MHLGPFNRLPMLAGGLFLLAGCVSPAVEPAGLPYPAPPPMPAETIPMPPVSEDALIWQPGHWDWTGGGYIWREGRWVPRGEHGTQWMPGYWAREGGVWNWMPAHWL